MPRSRNEVADPEKSESQKRRQNFNNLIVKIVILKVCRALTYPTMAIGRYDSELKLKI